MPSGFGKHLWNVTGLQLEGYLNVCYLGQPLATYYLVHG